jgi:choline dehydrogenase-like flavoprotein
MMTDTFDVVVVGSGPAGCAAAIRLGREGLTVALLEAHRDVNYYKRLCTHSMRSSELPTLRRLGLGSRNRSPLALFSPPLLLRAATAQRLGRRESATSNGVTGCCGIV